MNQGATWTETFTCELLAVLCETMSRKMDMPALIAMKAWWASVPLVSSRRVRSSGDQTNVSGVPVDRREDVRALLTLFLLGSPSRRETLSGWFRRSHHFGRSTRVR
jgi:hypothetical protein